MIKFGRRSIQKNVDYEIPARFDDYSGYEEKKMPTKKVKKQSSGRGIGCLKNLLGLALIILCAFLLAKFAWSVVSDVFAFEAEDTAKIIVEIPKGASTDAIAEILKDEGLIDYKMAFKLYSRFRENDGKYKYGSYELSMDMDYDSIMAKLKTDVEKEETVRVLIKEGLEAHQIAKLLADSGIGSEKKYLEIIKNPQYSYDFLEDLPDAEMKLEGYLFPDTYDFFKTDSEEVVLKKLLDNFDKKFTQELKDKMSELDMTMNEVITLASIIEREAGSDEERGLVSGVFHNRLSSRSYPYLESCATVQYILKERKEILSIADTKIESPYNTYQNPGLPVGPIASPGLNSIRAALEPEETKYNFFVWAPDQGKHLFAETLDAHNKNVKEANGN